MAKRRFADFVRTTTNSTGTGDLVCNAAFDALTRSLADAVAAGDLVYGDAVEVMVTDGVNRETSRATVTDDAANGSLTGRVFLTSTTGAAINWSAGSKHVRVTQAGQSITQADAFHVPELRLIQKDEDSAGAGRAASAFFGNAAGDRVAAGQAPSSGGAVLEVFSASAEQFRLISDNHHTRIQNSARTTVPAERRVDLSPWDQSASSVAVLSAFRNSSQFSQSGGYLDLYKPGEDDVQVRFTTKNGHASYIDNGGQLAIGFREPSAMLHLRGVTPEIRFQERAGGVDGPLLKIRSTNLSGMIEMDGTDPLVMRSNGVDRWVLDENGNIGLNTGTPMKIGTWTSTNTWSRFYNVQSDNNPSTPQGSAYIAAQGQFSANVQLYQFGGVTNQRHVQMEQRGGYVRWNTLNDDASSLKADAITIRANSLGNVGLSGQNSGTAKLWAQGGRLQLDNDQPYMWIASGGGTGFQLNNNGSDVFELKWSTSNILQIAESDRLLDFRMTMANSTKDPTTDAPDDWVEVKISGTTRYLPAYAAS